MSVAVMLVMQRGLARASASEQLEADWGLAMASRKELEKVAAQSANLLDL